MEETRGKPDPQPAGHVRIRRKRRHRSSGYDRRISAFFHAAGFVLVVLIGITLPWIYYAYHPGPMETRFGLVEYYLYFTCWLGVVIYLLAGAILGSARQWWQLALFAGIGIVLGWIGGWFFAGSLGEWYGLLTGVFISPLVFFIRWWILGLEL